MESLIIFAVMASIVIGTLFLYFDLWEEWSRCNVFGKFGIIALCLLGLCGIFAVIGFIMTFVSICYIVEIKKYLIKRECR